MREAHERQCWAGPRYPRCVNRIIRYEAPCRRENGLNEADDLRTTCWAQKRSSSNVKVTLIRSLHASATRQYRFFTFADSFLPHFCSEHQGPSKYYRSLPRFGGKCLRNCKYVFIWTASRFKEPRSESLSSFWRDAVGIFYSFWSAWEIIQTGNREENGNAAYFTFRFSGVPSLISSYTVVVKLIVKGWKSLIFLSTRAVKSRRDVGPTLLYHNELTSKRTRSVYFAV